MPSFHCQSSPARVHQSYGLRVWTELDAMLRTTKMERALVSSVCPLSAERTGDYGAGHQFW